MSYDKLKLDRALFPEKVGVSSKAINALIDDFKQSKVEIHSLMIIRHGKVAYESWAFPFTPEIPHIMYSVSKSFTSTAIGFAVKEGLLTLDTRLVDIFPQYAPMAENDEKLQKLTIYHLLTMTAGKSVSYVTDKTKNRWVEYYFDAQWKFAPGESWEYINENQYMLCAAINKLTGQSVRDFLKPRLFEPLGIDYPYWECDPNGIEAGGWGLYLRTEDLAKFTLCFLNGGKYNGKQVIDEEWVKFATSKLEDNSKVNFDADSIAGYGASFWRNGGTNGFRADGMFSQFGIAFEDHDACLILTACEVNEQKARDCIWRHFPAGFIEKYESRRIEAKQLAPLPELPASKVTSPFVEILKHKKIKIKANMPLEIANYPLSVLTIYPVYMSYDKAGYCTDFEFDFNFEKQECTMSWLEKDGRNTILLGLDGKVRFSKMRLAGVDFISGATACWINEYNFCVWVRPLGSIGQRRFRFEFSDDESVTLYPGSYQNLNDVAQNLSLLFVSNAKTSIGKTAITTSFSNVVPSFLEPKHFCKLVERE